MQIVQIIFFVDAIKGGVLRFGTKQLYMIRQLPKSNTSSKAYSSKSKYSMPSNTQELIDVLKKDLLQPRDEAVLAILRKASQEKKN